MKQTAEALGPTPRDWTAPVVIKSVPLTLGAAANSLAWGMARGVVVVIIPPGIFFWATRGVCDCHSEAGFAAEVRWTVNMEAPGKSDLCTMGVGAEGTGFPGPPWELLNHSSRGPSRTF